MTTRSADQAIVRYLFELPVLLLIGVVCSVAPWGAGETFATGVTPLSAPIFVLVASLPIAFAVYGKRTNLSAFDLWPVPMLAIAWLSNRWTWIPDVWAWTFYWYAACTGLYWVIRVYGYNLTNVLTIATIAAIGALLSVPFLEVVSGGDIGLPTVNQNSTAYTYTSVLYLLLLIQLTEVRLAWKWAALAVATILAVAVFFSGSRGAFLSICLMSLWMVVWRTAMPHARYIFFASVLIVLLFSFGYLEWVLRLVEGLFSNDTGDLSGRADAWDLARYLISTNMLYGIGPGAFEYVNPNGIPAHNIVLTLLLDVGIFGILAFGFFFLAGLWPSLRADSSEIQVRVLGLFATFFLPIASSGHVERSPSIWLAIALTFTVLRYNSIPISSNQAANPSSVSRAPKGSAAL